MAITASAVAIGALAVSSIEQTKRAEQAQDIQEERSEVERGIQQETAARARRAEVRKRLQATGEIENLAAQSGGTGGTAATQSIATVATQSASNIGAINAKVSGQNILTDLNRDLFRTQTPTDLERAAGFTASIFT